jgi:branched-chain amino acid transport system substrate-binding protein
MRRWLFMTAVMAAGCASGQSALAPPEPEPTEPEVTREQTLDAAPLEDARAARDDGDPGVAAVIADSLWSAWLGIEELDPGSAEDLTELLDSLGAEDKAAQVLVSAPFELDGGDRKTLRRLAEQLSIRELGELLDSPDAREEAKLIVRAELARALAVADHPDRARMLAEQVLEGAPDGAERDKAEDVLEGRVERAGEPVRIGMVLPATGRFATVGEQVLEGAMLALERYETDLGRAAIELIVLDDSSRVDTGIEHVEALEKRDVVAVLGPIRSEALVSAAIRRDRDDLFLISPTATGGQGLEPDAYSLWDKDRREADVATAVVSWMAEHLSLRKFGVLYPIGWSPGALQALRMEAETWGGRVLASEAYVPDSTTFAAQITALAAAEPEAVIVFSDGPRTVLQIAPQLVYYGLRRWVTAGDANWSDPAVLRRLEPSYSDHRLVGTYLDQVSPGTAWQQFKAAYEEEYRKSLPDNLFAALGYDAMNLILAGIPEAEPHRRGSIGRAVRRGVHFGATGDLSVDLQTGALRREVLVRVIEDGELRVPDAGEMLRWAEEQRELEEFLKELEEEEEKGEARQ